MKGRRVVTAVAGLVGNSGDAVPDGSLHIGDDSCQRFAIIEFFGQRHGMESEQSDLRTLEGGGDRHLHPEIFRRMGPKPQLTIRFPAKSTSSSKSTIL